jgi:PAS domain S-box-containing protein
LAEDASVSESTQRRFRDLVNSIDVIVWEADAQTFELLFVSRAAERILGYPRERWLREPNFWKDHLHAEDRDRAVALRAAATAEGRSYDAEYRMLSADGRIVWLRDIVTVVRAGKRPSRLRGVMVDITEQTLAMERLHSQQELLALAQKAAGAMAFDWHFDRPINVWSVEQEALYGLAPGSFDGTYASWKALVHPDDWPLVVEAMTRARVTGEVKVEFRVIWPDGSIHWLSANGQLFVDDRGQSRRMVGFTADITPRKQAEQALQKAQAALTHVTRVTTLGEVTASFAHELNQPLAAIANNANACLGLLSSGRHDPNEIREALVDIVADAERASAIIERVRALAKHLVPEQAEVRLVDVVNDVLGLAAAELAARRVAIWTDMPADLPTVVADRVQLQQVLLNLLVNAMDAMTSVDESRRRVEIRGRVGADDGRPAVTISVEDRGIGLQPDVGDRLFEAFYTTKSHGMGLGLAISRSIISAHGGRLWAERNQGPGATFSFSLPAAAVRQS